MFKLDSGNFIYLSANVSAIEKDTLLGKDNIEMMIDADSAIDAFDIFANSGFFRDCASEINFDNFIKISSESLLITKSYLLKPLNEKEKSIFDLIWLFYDLNNLKFFLRSSLLDKFKNKDYNEDFKNCISHLGLFSTKELEEFTHKMIKSFSKNKKFVGKLDIDSYFGKFIGDLFNKKLIEVIENFFEKKDMRILDFILDKFYLEICFKISKKIGFNFLKDFSLMNIDLYNISLLFRAKKASIDYKTFSLALADFGLIDCSVFLNLFEKDFDAFNNSGFKNYSKILNNLLTDSGNNDFLNLEKEISIFVSDFFDRFKSSYSELIVPILYFFERKRNTQLAQIVISGKTNGLSVKEIKKNLSGLI